MELPLQMYGMVLEKPGEPLIYKMMHVPAPDEDQVLIKVHACGICRTDLHIIDGELKNPKLPLIPGHEIIGTVVKAGRNVFAFKPGMLVGVPWLGYTCGTCKFCQNNQENLCDQPLFTGYTVDGGYAEYTCAHWAFCIQLPDIFNDPAYAPLLCAGLIGYRSLKIAGDHTVNLGIYGFGAAAHIITQIAIFQNKKVYAFTKDNDDKGQQFARDTGAFWAGNASELPAEKMDASIIFAPVGALIPKALQSVDKGGVVVCGGIHMSQIPSFPYQFLWEERVIRSVANLTRADAIEFMALVSKIPIETQARFYHLHEANIALNELRNGSIHGAGVLVVDGSIPYKYNEKSI